MMTWENILKEHKWKPERQTGWKKETRATPVKLVGNPNEPREEEELDIIEHDMGDLESELAEQTREDLLEMTVEKIESMSKQQLIDLLVRTKGTLEE